MNVSKIYHDRLINCLYILTLFLGCSNLEDLHDDHAEYKMGHSHSSCDIHTIKDGRWSHAGTWNINQIPRAGEQVCINHRINYDQDKVAKLSSI